jgi:hypothetical protein
MMVLGLRPEDGNEAGAIIGSYKCLGITNVRWRGKELQVKEHALADLRGGRREAGDMQVGIVNLANGTGDARAKEFGHQVDVVTGEMRMMREEAAV